MELDHLVPQARAGRNIDLVGFVALLEIAGLHLLEAVEARLALGLTSLGVGAHPLQFLLDGFLA